MDRILKNNAWRHRAMNKIYCFTTVFLLPRLHGASYIHGFILAEIILPNKSSVNTSQNSVQDK